MIGRTDVPECRFGIKSRKENSVVLYVECGRSTETYVLKDCMICSHSAWT